MVQTPSQTQSTSWHRLGEPEGKGWPADHTLRRYDRLPRHGEGRVPDDVWNLSRESSGLFHRFRTDASSIAARWTLGKEQLALPHMTAAGVSGLDLYGEDDEGRVRWVAMVPPSGFPDSEGVFNPDLDGRLRTYTVYLPLLNRLEDLEIGVPDGCVFELVDPDPTPPVVYYGTSIVHGASASRTGMSLPALVGRRLRRPVIGLGMSGHGRMEQEMAELIGEVEGVVYVVDCLPNMEPDLVTSRAIPFVRTLRAARPTAPILLVEDRTYTNAWVSPVRQQRNTGSRAALREAYAELSVDDPQLHYLGHEGLLGDDDEATIDCSHPTDLGFFRMAELITPVLQKLIASSTG